MTARLPHTKLPELPIEPLSESAWQRVERRVFEEMHAQLPAAPARAVQVWPWRILGLAAVGALSVLLANTWWRSAPAEARYTTQERTRALHVDGVDLRIEPASQLSRAGSIWNLQHGAAEFRVAKRKPRNPLTVLAGDVRVEVVGTVFRVVHRGPEVQVETKEGTVRVIHAGQAQLVTAGELWPRNFAATDDAIAAALAENPIPGETPTDDAIAAALPENATSDEAANDDGNVDNRMELRARQAAERDVRAEVAKDSRGEQPAHDSPTASGKTSLLGRNRTELRARGGEIDSRKDLRAGRSTVAGPVRGRLTDASRRDGGSGVSERQRVRFERASALEAREAGEALQLYRGLAGESGAWAGNALFALARLELELHLRAEAERDLRQYLERYPRGPNASDARALLATLHGERPGWDRAP